MDEQRIRELIEKIEAVPNIPDPSAWCQERRCGSHYIDFRTGKPYPCPHPAPPRSQPAIEAVQNARPVRVEARAENEPAPGR